jgi:uncharacterized integral membrane protein
VTALAAYRVGAPAGDEVRFVYWSVTLVAALVCLDFGVANLDPIVVDIWPVASFDSRFSIIVLLALLIGFLAGELVAWINGRGWRREARRCARRVEALERELAATRVPPPTPEVARLPVPVTPRD